MNLVLLNVTVDWCITMENILKKRRIKDGKNADEN